jgi:hypothetical protein
MGENFSAGSGDGDWNPRHALTSSVHDRMSVILDPEGYDLCLDRNAKCERGVCIVESLQRPDDAVLSRER